MLYRWIVKKRMASIFRHLSAGNAQPMLDGLAEDFSYRFAGESPLGGARHTQAGMERWWGRVFTFFPNAEFIPQRIVAEGWPWNTQAMTHVIIRDVIPSPSEQNEPYENEFMQLVTLKWGKVTSVTTIEDTFKFSSVLPQFASAGVECACAAPIVD